MKNNSIVVFAAHPDDEILGAGGSMAKWAKNGNDIHAVILAEGVTSRDISRDRKSRNPDLSELSKVAEKSAKIIGINTITMLDYPDNRMDSVDLLDVVKSVEACIDKLQPDIVITHHSNDLNIDHRIVHKAVLTACRPQPGISVKKILCFEVPSSTEWQSPYTEPNFTPNWFEDISETLDLKIEALKAYSSEMRKWPHSRSIKAVKHLAKWRGATVGCNAVESFMLIRCLE